MAATELEQRIGDRLARAMPERVREFPVVTAAGEGGLTVRLVGAAGSVTALRGLREKLQPLLKRVLREAGAGGVRFQTVDVTDESDLVLRIDLARV